MLYRLVVSFVCVISICYAGALSAAQKYIVTADSLNIRSLPAKKSRIIGSLKRGARVMLIQSKLLSSKHSLNNEYWYRLVNGRGYLHGQYVTRYKGGRTIVDEKNGRVIFFNRYFRAIKIMKFRSLEVVAREEIKKGNTSLDGTVNFQHVSLLSQDLFVLSNGVGAFRSECAFSSFFIYRRGKKIMRCNFVAEVRYTAKYNLIALFVYERSGLYEMTYSGKILFVDGRTGSIKKQLKVLDSSVTVGPTHHSRNYFSKDKTKNIWEIGGQRIVIDLRNFSVRKSVLSR